jgi:outer membrane cobalamin receptor
LIIKPIEKLSFGATVSYKSAYKGRHYDAGIYSNVITDMDAFCTVDLNANYKFDDKFSFWVKGFNLTNADYSIVDGYPMPGTTFYAGVDFKFWK